MRQLDAKPWEIAAGLVGGGIQALGIRMVGSEREVATSCHVMVFVACTCQGLRSCVSQLGSSSANLLPGS